MTCVLIVEDDPQFGNWLEKKVKSLGLLPFRAANLADARKLFANNPIRLVILDRKLEDEKDSIGFCLEIKKDPRTRSIPVVVLTGLGELSEQLKSYRFGADLFLQKEPELLPKLTQFLQTFLKRLPYIEEASGRLLWGPIAVDVNERVVRFRGRAYPGLPPKQFELIKMLVSRQGAVATRESLLKTLWKLPVRDKEIDVLVSRLKARLQPADASLIEAVRGEGYRLADHTNQG